MMTPEEHFRSTQPPADSGKLAVPNNAVKNIVKNLVRSGVSIEQARLKVKGLQGVDPATIEGLLTAAYERGAVKALTTCSLHDTFNKPFEGPDWIIKPLVHVGANLLSSDPKCGKSYLCLAAALAVGQNKPLLSRFEVNHPGRVLYFALEDGERRIKKRLHELGVEDHGLENIDMLYRLERSFSSPEGRAELEATLQLRAYSLCIVDTLAKVCTAQAGGDVYRQQYQEMDYFQTLAEKHHCAFLISTHNNKGAHDGNSLAKLGGSFGRSGAVAGNLIMEKLADRTALTIQSRDADHQVIALKWGGESKGWMLLTDAEIQAESQVEDIERRVLERLVLDCIREHAPIGRSAIADTLGKQPTAVKRCLEKLLATGAVVGSGKHHARKYNLPERTSSTKHAEGDLPF